MRNIEETMEQLELLVEKQQEALSQANSLLKMQDEQTLLLIENNRLIKLALIASWLMFVSVLMFLLYEN
jgi:hypothetical protein